MLLPWDKIDGLAVGAVADLGETEGRELAGDLIAGTDHGKGPHLDILTKLCGGIDKG